MLLKSRLGFKCHSQYIRLFQHSSANSYLGCIVRDLETYSLSLTRIQFHLAKVTPLANLSEVTVQGLCNS